MTPREHYRMAEALIEAIVRSDASQFSHHSVERTMRLAQVHATLANAHMTTGVWDKDET